MILKIANWDEYFENAGSRKLKRLEWIAMPNRMDGCGYTALVDHPNGAAHFGAWCAIVQIASRQNERGTIPQGVGGICRSLGRISRLPSGIFEEAIPRLIEIGWIQEIQQDTGTLGESANALGESAGEVSAQGREGKGITGKGTQKTARAPNEDWRLDEQFGRFVTDYLATGASLIDADFADAWEWCWRKLDLPQKLERIQGLNRHQQEYAEDPRFVPKPRKFLESEWERLPRPPARGPQSVSLADRTMALVKTRIASGRKPI